MSENNLPVAPDSEPDSARESAPKRRTVPLGVWIAGGILLLAAAVAIPVISAQVAKSNQIRDAVSACNILITEYRIMDDGNAVALSSVGLSSGPEVSKVVCLLDELDAPQTVPVKIGNTRALDGTVSADWSDFSAQWTYHPDDGLNILIERAR